MAMRTLNDGNTAAQFLPWNLETYEFSSADGSTRADQEAQLRALNAGASAFANEFEWSVCSGWQTERKQRGDKRR